MKNLILLLAVLLTPLALNAQDPFSAPETVQKLKRNPLDLLRELEPQPGEQYLLSPGDEITVEVVGRAELSGRHVIGPDGRITLPVAGPLFLADRSREDAAANIRAALREFYAAPAVTVKVERYGGNRIVLVGRVPQPGVLYFDRPPTLLEVLARAGSPASPDGTAEPLPARCAVFRGKEKVFWLDIRTLLEQGGSVLDLRLRPNDIVYIPGDQEEYVSVLGEVGHPGAVRLRRGITLTEVLALAGGLTEKASTKSIRVITPDTGMTREVSMRDLLEPARGFDITLHRGDVIYVPTKTLAKVGYVLQQFSPVGTLLMVGAVLAN